jgi:tetratricopeptide (TPR) repeat protein
VSTYLGNPSLSTAVKERVSSTFQQALTLFRSGQTDQVIAGCNLILQMDPQFDPARKLLEKARNPAALIDVDSLVGTTTEDDAMRQANEAMKARDYSRVIQITTEILTNDLMNDEARILGDQAREKLEAAPFVDQFVAKCEQHIAAGNVAAAKTDLEKARSLDADHPGIRKMESMISAKEPSAAPQAYSFDSAASFVVDPPKQPESTRGAAQAADFGFTFEEEKPSQGGGFADFSFGAPAEPAKAEPAGGGFAGFSFDSPAEQPAAQTYDFGAAPPPKVEATGEFDFSTASIETSPDDQKKIEGYLSEGDHAFDGGDYQGAIDLWSRIFLIDVTNDQASERIERAKAKRRESEQRLEAVLSTATAAFARGDRAAAREKFTEVLQIDPNNATARDYLDRMSSEPAAAETFAPPPDEKFDVFADDMGLPSEVITPPEPDEIPAATPPPPRKAGPAKAPAAAGKKAPLGLIAGVLAIVVLAAGGWFAWKRLASQPAADPVQTQAALTRATTLAQQGQYDQAIAILQNIKPGDPEHDRALVMIAELQQKKATAAQMIDGKPAAIFYDEQIALARSAFDAHDYAAAKRALEQATRVKPLSADAQSLYQTAAQQVAMLDGAKGLFRERRFQEALSSLQTLLTQDPQNKDIQRLITDAHFNIGALALQEEKTQDAIQAFDQVLQSNPNDELARRSRELALRYDGEPKDLLYRIYIKYLPFRQPM